MAIEQNLAGVARVAYEAVGLSEFRADNTAAERSYRSATDGMSDAALKLELAQERLRRSLAKGPASSQQSARALLQVRQAERELAAETSRATTQIQRQDRALDGLGRSRGLSRLRSQVVGLSAAFLSTTGLVYGAKRAIDVASNLEEQTQKTRDVFGSSATQVERFAKDALGLANDQALELTSTLGALLRPIGIVGKESSDLSEDLIRRGVDLASFYNTDVRSAIEAARSGIVGEAEPLRRYGVRLSEARVQALALQQTGKDSVKQLTDEEKVRARIAIIFKDSSIAAGNYRKTIEGVANQEREAAANWRDTQAVIGQTLLPAYRDLLGQVNDYLGDAKNQREIQERLNRAIETGGQVVEGLADGLRLVKAAAEPVVDALGGVENAAQLALIVGIVAKTRRAAASFGLIAGASAATRTKVIADAAAMGAALDVATRPRVVPVTVVQRIGQYGAPIPGGGTGPAPRGGGRIPWVLGFNAPTAVAAAVVMAGGASGARTGAFDAARYPRVASLLQKIESGGQLTPAEQQALSGFRGRSVSELSASELARLNRTLTELGRSGPRGRRSLPRGVRLGDPLPSRAGGGGDGGGGGGGNGDGLTTVQRLELASQQAGLTESLADDLSAAQALEAYYAKIASNEKLKGDKLFQARQDLIAAQARTRAVEQQIAADRLADQQAAAAKRKENAAKLARARAAEKRERERQAAIVARELDQGPYATTSGGFNKAGVDPAFAKREHERRFGKAADKERKGLTEEDFRRMSFDLLRSLHGTIGQFGSNVDGPGIGQVATHAYAQTELLREQNDIMRGLSSTVRGPGARYAAVELTAAGHGVGF